MNAAVAMRSQGIRQYQQVGTNVAVTSASPHGLIQMLYDGALDRIASAIGAQRAGDTSGRIRNVSKAISIIEYLQLSLDRDVGAISEQLSRIYGFCLEHLTKANASADEAMLQQVADTLRPLKAAWDEIR